MTDEIYDIAILGAGPIGLEAALRAADDGYKTIVIERGEIGQNVRDWGHVKMFSPFGMNSSERGREVIGETPKIECLQSGLEYCQSYIEPLAHKLAKHVAFRTGHRIERVVRVGWPKSTGVGGTSRAYAPLRVFTEGQLPPVNAWAVCDCTGTYDNNLIDCGEESKNVPLLGCEDDDTVGIGIVDSEVLARSKQDELCKRVLVIGSGFSAATNIVALAQLPIDVVWLTRRSSEIPIDCIKQDPLRARSQLVAVANELALSGRITWYPESRVESIQYITVENKYPSNLVTAVVGGVKRQWITEENRFCQVFANIGYRPDTSIFRELHVHLCYATEGPIQLAAKLLGEKNSGAASDCLTQTCDDASLLVNPEPNFFILGAKSYGRNSNFLIRVGIEQVNAVFDELLPKTLWPLIGRS